jgi:hypothetical protein
MANFLDEDLNQDDSQDTSDINEADTQHDDINNAQTDNESASQQEEDDIPEKYRGKSAKEIARMHQEAEKALGRQGSEVGELRRVVDDFIKAQTVTQQKQAPDTVDEDVDFFADPEKAVSRAIANHPKIKEAEMVSNQMKQAEAVARLKAAHPDHQQVIADPEFAEWVGKSRVRQELFVRADKAFDLDAADELLSTWKERKAVVESSKAVGQAERKQAVKAASTGSAKSAGESGSKKTYRRSDIIDLMVRNPERYAALSDEIMAAYAQGRVK